MPAVIPWRRRGVGVVYRELTGSDAGWGVGGWLREKRVVFDHTDCSELAHRGGAEDGGEPFFRGQSLSVPGVSFVFNLAR